MDCLCAKWYYNCLKVLISTGLSCSSFAGLPHYIDTDDIYNKYRIPGGSIILANLWSVLLYLPRILSALTHIALTGA
jgi:hypothetical protein